MFGCLTFPKKADPQKKKNIATTPRIGYTPLKINILHIIMEVCKIIFLSKWVICMFHGNLPGCKCPSNYPPWHYLTIFLLQRWHQASTSAHCSTQSGLGLPMWGACPSRNTVWLKKNLTRTNIPEVDLLNSTDELILLYVKLSFILTVFFFLLKGFKFYRLHPLFWG